MHLSGLFDVLLDGSSCITDGGVGKRRGVVERAYTKLVTGRANQFNISEALVSPLGEGRLLVKIIGDGGMVEFRVARGYNVDAAIPFLRTLVDWVDVNQQLSYSGDQPSAVLRPIEILDAGDGIPQIEPPTDNVGPVQNLDGAGSAPQVGSIGGVNLYLDRVEIGSPGSMAVVANEAATDDGVDGHSRTTGGSYLGGGSEAKSAPKGMVLEGALNALTASTSTWATVMIVTSSGRVTFRVDNLKATQVRNVFRHLSDKAIANGAEEDPRRPVVALDDVSDDQLAKVDRGGGEREVPGAQTAMERVSALERLARLHETGAITDREFTAAKQDLLGLTHP